MNVVQRIANWKQLFRVWRNTGSDVFEIVVLLRWEPLSYIYSFGQYLPDDPRSMKRVQSHVATFDIYCRMRMRRFWIASRKRKQVLLVNGHQENHRLPHGESVVTCKLGGATKHESHRRCLAESLYKRCKACSANNIFAISP
jgi:hypothetical protein